nr:hypothetical protein [Synechococcus sp. CCY 0621]
MSTTTSLSFSRRSELWVRHAARVLRHRSANASGRVPSSAAGDVLGPAVRDLLPQLQDLRDSLPHQATSGVETMRTLRDDVGS